MLTTRGLAKAVFLDKDGTLVEDVPYNVDVARIRPGPGAGFAVRALHEAGFRLVVVTNQSGVARGLFLESALQGVAAHLRDWFAAEGASLTGFYYCPHQEVEALAVDSNPCDCRKPRPGMIRRAAAEHGLDLARSWMVGDILNDVEAGVAAGCRTVLVDNGNETEWVRGPARTPDFVVVDLAEAARVILAHDATSDGPGVSS